MKLNLDFANLLVVVCLIAVISSAAPANKPATSAHKRVKRAFKCFRGVCKRPPPDNPTRPFSPTELELGMAELRDENADGENPVPVEDTSNESPDMIEKDETLGESDDDGSASVKDVANVENDQPTDYEADQQVPAEGMTGGSDGMTGGSDGMTGGSDGMTGGSDVMTGDSDGMTGGSDGMTGGSDGMTGGSDGMMGGSDGMTGGSDGMTGGSDGDDLKKIYINLNQEAEAAKHEDAELPFETLQDPLPPEPEPQSVEEETEVAGTQYAELAGPQPKQDKEDHVTSSETEDSNSKNNLPVDLDPDSDIFLDLLQKSFW